MRQRHCGNWKEKDNFFILESGGDRKTENCESITSIRASPEAIHGVHGPYLQTAGAHFDK